MATADAGIVTGDQVRLLRDGRETTRITLWSCRLVALMVVLFGLFGAVSVLSTAALMLGEGLAFTVTNGPVAGISAFAATIVAATELYIVLILQNPAGLVVRAVAGVAVYYVLLYVASDPVAEP